MEGVHATPVKAPVYETTSFRAIDGSSIYVQRYGNWCTLLMNLVAQSNISAWASIANAPARYRPIADVYFSNALGTSIPNGLNVGFSLGTTGAIATSTAIPAGTAIWATVTYIAQQLD